MSTFNDLHDETKTDDCPKDEHMPRRLLMWPIAYIMLAVVAALWPGLFDKQTTLPGGVPVAMAWYGMLGGVTVALLGMFYHNEEWDRSYSIWYGFSGTIGAIYGVFAYLILAMVQHSTSSSSSLDALSPTFLVGAFLLGFSQREFSTLAKKAFSLVFQEIEGKTTKWDRKSDAKPDETTTPDDNDKKAGQAT